MVFPTCVPGRAARARGQGSRVPMELLALLQVPPEPAPAPAPAPRQQRLQNGPAAELRADGSAAHGTSGAGGELLQQSILIRRQSQENREAGKHGYEPALLIRNIYVNVPAKQVQPWGC